MQHYNQILSKNFSKNQWTSATLEHLPCTGFLFHIRRLAYFNHRVKNVLHTNCETDEPQKARTPV